MATDSQFDNTQPMADLVSPDHSFSLTDKRGPSKSFKLEKRDRRRENSSHSEDSSQASTG